MKSFIVLLFILLLSACGKVLNSNAKTTQDNQEAKPFCLTTQSQCQISTMVGDFDVTFAQVQPDSQPHIQPHRQVQKPPDTIVDKTGEPKLHNIRTELPFSIFVKQNDKTKLTKEVDSISGYLEGKDMFMGKVPVFFSKTKEVDKFAAVSLLASCSEDVMVWRLWLIVQLADQQKTEQRFFIEFESLRL